MKTHVTEIIFFLVIEIEHQEILKDTSLEKKELPCIYLTVKLTSTKSTTETRPGIIITKNSKKSI